MKSLETKRPSRDSGINLEKFTNGYCKKQKPIENKIASLESLSSQLDDLIALTELCIEEGDEDTAKEITEGLDDFKRKLENEKLATLLTGEYDNSNAILTFHAGAGGTEAQDWAEMLYRMYNRWGESHGFKINLLDYLDGDEAGLKSASILMKVKTHTGYLKSEAGWYIALSGFRLLTPPADVILHSPQ